MFIELLKKAGVYPGYPEVDARKTMSYGQWARMGKPAGVLTAVCNHPNYVTGVQMGRAATYPEGQDLWGERFSPSTVAEYTRDSIGRPVTPYAPQLLESGLAIEGVGAYLRYGPNFWDCPIVIGLSARSVVKVYVMRKGDGGLVALPSGQREADDRSVATAAMIFRRETGIWLEAKQVIYSGFFAKEIAPDPRTTLNAWTEMAVAIFILRGGVIDRLRMDAAGVRAECLPVDNMFYARIDPAHATYVRQAVGVLENNYQVKVDWDGCATTPRGLSAVRP